MISHKPRPWRVLPLVLLPTLAMCQGPDLPDQPGLDPPEATVRNVQTRPSVGALGLDTTMSPALRLAFIQNHQRDADDSYAFVPANAQTVTGGADLSRDVSGTDDSGGSGVFAQNRAHAMSVSVNATEGIKLSWLGTEQAVLSLKMVRYGRDGGLKPVPTATAVSTDEARATLKRGTSLEEWYQNGPLGLEQGVTVNAPPSAGDQPLAFEMRFEGAVPRLLDDGVVVLDDPKSRTAFARYTDLFATDADGVMLNAWMLVDGQTVRLMVDDTEARYPLVIDPLVWSQRQKLLESDGSLNHLFGSAVAVSGDTAIIGASGSDGLVRNSGSAYVFVRSEGIWTQQQKLFASDGAFNDRFGAAVALSGDLALVGATGDDDWGSFSGSAYVFVRSGGVWTQQQKFLASDGAMNDVFGFPVALSGDTALIGAHRDDDQGEDSGSAYVFVQSSGIWTQQQKLVASDGAARDRFGWSCALRGETALIGADLDDVFGFDSGSAYVFVRSGDTWSEQQKLQATDRAAGDQFGSSVALTSSTAVVGARNDDDRGTNSGSAYVFTRSANVWTQQQKLIASDGAANDRFGDSVALSGDTALIGVRSDDDPRTDSGSAYIFVQDGGTWSQQEKLRASDGAANDYFGYSVALSGNTALIGAPYDDDRRRDSGSVYAFAFLDLPDVGTPCTTDIQCASGHCVDDVCCDTPCGGSDTSDCQACSVATGATVDGTCEPVPAGTTCRTAAGVCDAPESCDGIGTACPSDGRVAAGIECRPAAGVCDVAEQCDGLNSACPDDLKASMGFECRPASGLCDVAELCDGVNDNCPDDARAPSGQTCRTAASVCDAEEQCDGVSTTCPDDGEAAPGSAGTVCRPSRNVCDVAEACDGLSNACPTDAKVATGVECRAAAGVCDVSEACDGLSDACPTNAKVAAGVECRAAAGVCDVAEACNGVSSVCPADAKASPDQTCRPAAGACDAEEQCNGVSDTCPEDGKVALGTECRPAVGLCDRAEACDGATNECPADGLQPAGTLCREASNLCDAEEQCTGSAGTCPEDATLSDGAPCRDVSGICQQGICNRSTVPPAGESDSGCRAAGAPPPASSRWSVLLLLLVVFAGRRRTTPRSRPFERAGLTAATARQREEEDTE